MTYYRNTWYVAAWGHEIGGGLSHRVILDDDILLFRDEAGRPGAVANMCPHRFAPLHLGRKVGGNVECGYHGLQFDSTGACVHNPHGNGGIPSACRVKSYPVVERHGAVWIWPGDPERADAATVPDFGHLAASTNKTVFGSTLVQANYQLINDNLMDASHTQYVHSDHLGSDAFRRSDHQVLAEGGTISSNYVLPSGPIPAAYRLYFDDPDQPVIYSASFRWYPASLVRNTISITPVEPSEQPGIQRIGSHFMTPESPTSTHYFFAHTRSFRLDDEAIDEQIRRWQKTGLAGQDGTMLEAVQRVMGTRDLDSMHPALLSIDPAAVRVRQALKRLMRQSEPAMA